LVALGEAIDERAGVKTKRRRYQKKKRSRRRKVILRGAIVLGVVLVLVVGGVVGDYFYLGSLLNRQHVGHLQSQGSSVNILLIGSTTRCGLKVQNQAYGTCAQGVTGVNSDIVMIVHLDPATRKVSLLSIPRDTFVPNALTTGANKIDAALYQGPSQLVAVIEEDFGIPINHYVELNFDTFAAVVNALGGVRMYFPMPVFDAYSGLYVPHPGCIQLDGFRALQVVRARHLQIQTNPAITNRVHWTYEALSDIARIRRTHEFLRVLAAKVSARGLGNPLTDQSIAASVLPDLTVDTGFSEGTMVSLATTFAHTNIANVAQDTFPVVSVNSPSGYLYGGYSYGSIVFPVEPTGYGLIDQLFGATAGVSPFTGHVLPAPSTFKVSVVNGSGIANQATTVAAGLTAKGYRISTIGNRVPTGPITETVVWYGGTPPPDHTDWINPGLEAAQSVMSQIEGPAIMGYSPSEVTPGALVTVQTGTGLTLKPTASVAPATTPATASSFTSASLASASVELTASSSSSTPTTTTVLDPSGIATNPNLGTPSATNPALKPWDPRACNAAGTGPAPTP
jgi:LCP family protein required for cell wall assembly